MLIQDKLQYMMAGGDYYESLGLYEAREHDFREPLERILPEDWEIQRRDLWFECMSPESAPPAKGWKIHLSANWNNVAILLVTAARILFEAGVPFKFVADRVLFLLTNGKRWARGSSGKFLTAYPSSQEQCGELLEKLHKATVSFEGPYILSDRRYRDSQVVHYRYGGIFPTKRADVDGRAVHVISDDEGGYVDDERTPYFRLPEGKDDPFLHPDSIQDDEGEDGTLKDGRYEIQSVLAFSNPGGVYLAKDRENDGRQVVIKEGRPNTNISVRGLDAVDLMAKEHRLLGLVADTGIAPQPYDFFVDWEHAYLVEEYYDDAISLRGYLAGFSIALYTRPDHEQAREFYSKYCDIFRRVAEMVKTLHERHIVFSDLSFNNIMVLDEDAEELRLVDFEGAYEEGVDRPSHVFSPGFTPEETMQRGSTTADDDVYALGGLMVAGLFPMNQLLMIDPDGYQRWLKAYEDDFDLPKPIAQLIRRLLDADAKSRPDIDEVIEVLSRDYDPAPPRVGSRELDEVDLDNVIERTVDYIESSADFEREDRLYPADPAVFDTNPLSIAHGACGVAHVLHEIRGEVDPQVIDWIRDREIRPEAYSPGLYVGLSGIAWSLLDLGHADAAHKVLDLTGDHHLLWRSPDLFYGASGWGLTQLRFYRETGEAKYLEAAKKVGDFLLESHEADEDTALPYWLTQEDDAPGLAHGSAGIALYLLYLYQATDNDTYLEIGRRSLDWVVEQGRPNLDGGLTWAATRRAPSLTPYWRWGSSGIGRALLRYHHVTGSQEFADTLDQIHVDCDRKYAIYPSYFFGLAGIADFYLDMARFPRWAEDAEASLRKLLSGILLFGLERDEGLAFPGESISRISSDYGTGGAGIVRVMHRYRNRGGASFLLDEMLPEWSTEDRLAEPVAATAGRAAAA